jgi:hypothetical protein
MRNRLSVMRPEKGRRGSALAMVLPMSMVFAMLGMVSLSVSMTSMRLSTHRHRAASAFELAEAGFSHAVKSMQVNKNYAGQGRTEFGEGSFEVRVTQPGTDWNKKVIVVIGRTKTPVGTWVEKQVMAKVDFQSPVWNYGIITKTSMSVAGGSIIDSQPAVNEGNVHANGNLTIGSNATIFGDATATGTITNGGTVTGDRIAGADVVAFPVVDTVALKAQAEAKGITTGNLSYNSGTNVLGGKVVGNVSANSDAVIRIDGLLWVTGSVALSGRSWLGNGVLVCEGPLTLSGGASFTGAENSSLGLISLSSANPAITLIGNSTLRGPVYCPNGTTSLGGGTRFYGTIATNALTMSGGAHVTVLTDYQAPQELADRPRVQSWQEL